MDHLLTEARNPASADLDRLSSLEFVRLMCAEDAKIIPAVAARAEAIARAIEVIAERLQRGGRLIYSGAGTSGRLGVLDASECPPTFNSPPNQVVGIIAGGSKALTTAVEGAEDHPESAAADLRALKINEKDVLVGIATSGRTPYVIGALKFAKSVGAFPIGLACVPDSELVPCSDILIAPLVGPEVVTGSTRLKAGTATKLVLNMLSTGAMVRIGKTYGNLMVDLRATNIKLKARTNRIVRHFTGLSVEEADALLVKCDGELKTALVAHRASLAPQQARERLQQVKGKIAQVFDGPAAERLAYDDLIIGIDGGGTHTTALLARINGNGFEIVGRGRSGPSNLRAAGESVALPSLDSAISSAFADAKLDRGKVRALCMGLAGAGRENEQALLKDWAARLNLADHVSVVSDSSLLLSMLPGRWGVAVIAGTGSAVWGRDVQGRTARCGGWGPLVGDEGSAYAIVLAGLRAVLRHHDGSGEATSLTGSLLERMQLTSPEQIISAIHGGGWDRPRLAALTKIVFDAMANGDTVSTRIVQEAARELAMQIATVVRQLDLSRHRTPLALSGGLLLNLSTYVEEMRRELLVVGIDADMLAVPEPAEGALKFAHTI